MWKGYRNHGYGGREQKLYEAMYAVADNHNLYDMKIYPEFLALADLIENEIPWLKVMMEQFRPNCNNETRDAQVSILVDMLKYYKKRVNADHYVKITEQEDLEPITEEIVEESVF